MINLVQLVCKQCGSALHFEGKRLCKCASCGTSYVLASDGDELLHQYSFFPQAQNLKGKLAKSLKMELVGFIRATEEFFVTDYRFYESNVQIDSEGHFHYDELVGDDDGSIVVGVMGTRMDVVGHKGFLGWQEVYGDVPCIVEMCQVFTIPVEGPGKVFVGDRISIRVNNPKYEEAANALSELIMNKFKVVPEVTLANG